MDWLEPLCLTEGPAAAAAVAAGQAAWLQGGPVAFLGFRLHRASQPPLEGSVAELLPEAMAALARVVERPAPYLGLGEGAPDGRVLVMGILNATPDSFSDGGRHHDVQAAIAAGHAMIAAGADILDIGGESTRPGSEAVPVAEEIRRILPVVEALAPHACISLDTRNAETMRAGLAAGARIVNDISAGRHDPATFGVVAESGAGLILMHMRGMDPRVMQQEIAYEEVGLDVARFLAERVAAAEAAGIARHQLCLDPGIGFGKTQAHNLALIRRLPLLANLGLPVLLAASRKGFIGQISGEAVAARRLGGSVAVALAGAAAGAVMVRVHDVAETAQALRLRQALLTAA